MAPAPFSGLLTRAANGSREQTMVQITGAYSGDALEDIRMLFAEYAASLPFELSFQGFHKELASLPGEYTPPSGRLLLATDAGNGAGCAALRKMSADSCELKRMYVRPDFRGKGIGRLLAEHIVSEARSIGYGSIRLDTIASMKEAISLYRSLGFVAIAPYRFNPIEGAQYMELRF